VSERLFLPTGIVGAIFVALSFLIAAAPASRVHELHLRVQMRSLQRVPRTA